MDVSVEQLLTPQTYEESRKRMLCRLTEAGFPVTDWTEGGCARTLVEMSARESEFFSMSLVDVGRSGFLSTASGAWLTLLAREFYALDRYGATYTEGRVVLTDERGEGPFTVLPGQLWFSSGLLRFTNTTGGVLEEGGSLELVVRAESPGASYNVPSGSIRIMLTTLVGVAVNNPSPWILHQGSNEESDDLLRQRCRSRWATLGIGANADWYVYHARNGHPYVEQVTRVLVSTLGDGSNTVKLLMAGPDGPLDSELKEKVITSVYSSIRAKMPLTTRLIVEAAVAKGISLMGVIYAYPSGGDAEAIKDRAMLELGEYIRSIGIGEKVYWTQIVDALQFDINVVRNVILMHPSDDVVPDENEIVHISSTMELFVQFVS